MAVKSGSMRKVKGLALAIAFMVSLIVLGLYLILLSSLPALEGNIVSSSIAQNILLERDKNGNATLTADNRLDIAYGTGFLHAQERFFQMDLSRRMAAGELSELFGPAALDIDKKNRLHRFRARAKIAIEHMPEENRNLLKKYVIGLNDGLKNLKAKPFEYWLLQQEPKAWTAEDSFLVIYSMFFTLQQDNIAVELHRYFLSQSLDKRLVDFLLPIKTEWDAPLEKESKDWMPQAIPPRDVVDGNREEITFLEKDETPVPGSNNWAVSGKMTKTGAAILSNDMHLDIRAPSTWFRLRLKIKDTSVGLSGLDISGVSLPGTPLIIVGSNGSVAWGFTNSYVDTVDLVALKINPKDDNEYLTPKGYLKFTPYVETIAVSGEEPYDYTIRETIWGPVLDSGNGQKQGQKHGQKFAVKWVAHQPEAVNMGLVRMERVKTVKEAMTVAPKIGIPTQNAMITDSKGHIGWTLFGALPKRKIGPRNEIGDYSQPADWSDGKMGWDGWLGSDEYPYIYDPDNNRLWSANSRMVSGKDYQTIGDGGTDIGVRQKQIRDDLMALDKGVAEKDLYAIQLDNRAIFWYRWQKQLLTVLHNSQDARLAPFIKAVENWDGRAVASSVAFRLVINYRKFVYRGLMGYVTQPCRDMFKLCDYNKATNQMESPLWRLVEQRPDGWLPKSFNNAQNVNNGWQVFFETVAVKAWAPVIKGKISLENYIWGEENRAQIKHPMSDSVPFLSYLTDMPDSMQDGVYENIPHIAGNSFGQSERITVSPGHEEDGIMNIPAGQSGHPLSPYYGAGHRDWLKGTMAPFLPGETKWSLQFVPH